MATSPRYGWDTNQSHPRGFCTHKAECLLCKVTEGGSPHLKHPSTSTLIYHLLLLLGQVQGLLLPTVPSLTTYALPGLSLSPLQSAHITIRNIRLVLAVTVLYRRLSFPCKLVSEVLEATDRLRGL